MSNQEQDSGSAPFHEEGGAVIFDKPNSQEEIARRRREDEQHEFARSQVKTNKRLAWFTGALTLATFCTIGVGIWQACIYGGQLGVMKGQLKQMKGSSKQTDAMLCWYRQQLAEMQRQAEASITQAEAVSESELPRFELTKNGIDIAKDKQQVLTIPIEITNAGKTMARDVHISVMAVLVDSNKDPSQFDYKGKYCFRVGGPIWESGMNLESQLGKGRAGVAVSDEKGNLINVDDSRASQIKSGEKHVVVYGRITFRDFLGVRHWENMCSVSRAAEGVFRNSGHERCTEYNSNDNNHAIQNEKMAIDNPPPCPASTTQ